MIDQGARRKTGVVKWWSETKGIGFIVGEDGTEFFVHYSGVRGRGGRRNLMQDAEVEFEPVDTPKGPRAVEVEMKVGERVGRV